MRVFSSVSAAMPTPRIQEFIIGLKSKNAEVKMKTAKDLSHFVSISNNIAVNCQFEPPNCCALL